MAIKLTTTDRFSFEHGVKVLIYGRAGAGKTRLCETAPEPLIISAEAGLLSLRHASIPVIEIKSMQDLTEAYTFVATSEEAKQFQTICLDSISEIGEVCLAHNKAQFRDPRQAYGELIDQMQKMIRAFRDLPGKHVYFSAKQELNKDEVTGVTMCGPSMPGSKLGPQLPYFFDEVFHLGVGKNQEGEEYRYLRTQPDIQYEAKDRSGVLDAIEYPDLRSIFNKIMAVPQPTTEGV